MSFFWGSRSYSGGGGQTNGSDQQDGYGYGYGGGQGQQYESTGGKKRGSSRLKKSSGSKTDADASDDYPKYTSGTKDEADDYRYSRPNGNYSNGSSDSYNSGRGRYTGGTAVGAPYYGGGYGSSSPYGSGGGYGSSSPYAVVTGGGGYAPYNNIPSAFWTQQDGNRSPMFISAKEVHVHGMTGYDNDNSISQQQGKRRGFFAPAFHAVGHFFDSRFGFSDRD